MATKRNSSKTAKSVNRDVPPGYEVMDAGGDFAPWHDFNAEPVLQGKVVSVHTATMGKGKERKERTILTVKTAHGERSVSDSFKLNPLFAAAKKKKGHEVYIKFLGQVRLKGGRRMNDYIAAIK